MKTLRTRVIYTETLKQLGVPSQFLNQMLDHHLSELASNGVTSGIRSSEYALDFPGGSETIVIATDVGKGLTYVGLPEDFTF